MRYILMVVILSGSSISRADSGDIIDRCSLDRNGIPHCSTPNRREAAASKAVFDSMVSFDTDERMSYLAIAAQKWSQRQKGQCHEKEVDTGKVFNAYNYPGKDDGADINKIEDPCDRKFAIWLFQKENHGHLPSALARVLTIVAEETAAARQAMKTCPREAKDYIKSLQAWLAAERELESARPSDIEKVRAKAQERYDAREYGVKALNSCLQ
jgi:hypothetical protein